MNDKLIEVGTRLRELRTITDYSVESLAEQVGVSPEDYIKYENGEKDFSITFLFKVAKIFGVDITEIMTGDSPRLSEHSIVKNNEGFPIERRKGFKYQHMSYLLKNKACEPFVVFAPFDSNITAENISMSSHLGQELDFIIEGELTIVINGHVEHLKTGDLIQYDSSKNHGMFATTPTGCKFLAVVIDKK